MNEKICVIFGSNKILGRAKRPLAFMLEFNEKLVRLRSLSEQEADYVKFVVKKRNNSCNSWLRKKIVVKE